MQNLGIAHDNGLIGDLDQPIQYFFPKYIDTLHTATWPVSLKDALTMSAGLDWNKWELPISDPENDVIKMLFSQDMYDFVLKRNIAAGTQPGDKFEYNSGLSVLLGGVILDATGMPADTYAEKHCSINWESNITIGFPLQMKFIQVVDSGYGPEIF